jgi:thiol peroxidase
LIFSKLENSIARECKLCILIYKKGGKLSTVTLKGEVIKVEGKFLIAHDLCPDFLLITDKLESKTLKDFKGKKKVLATVPSVDTKVCAMESKVINDLALENPNIVFLVVSKDLPFALDRFCHSQGLKNVIMLSDMRSNSTFAKDYGVKITSGILSGLLCRSIIFLDEFDRVIYSELVKEVSSMPNFEELKRVLKGEGL